MSLDSHLIRDIHLFILDIHLLEWVSSLTDNENIFTNKINMLYCIDFIGIFVSI